MITEAVIVRLIKVCKTERNSSDISADLFEYVRLKTQVINLKAPRDVLIMRFKLSMLINALTKAARDSKINKFTSQIKLFRFLRKSS